MSSCENFRKDHLEKEFTDKVEDRDAALNVIEKFHEKIEAGQYDEAVSFFTPEVINQKGPNRISYMLRLSFTNAGKQLKTNLIDWETWRKFGVRQEGYYYLVFRNYYEKDTIHEIFELRLLGRNDIRISSFVPN